MSGGFSAVRSGGFRFAKASAEVPMTVSSLFLPFSGNTGSYSSQTSFARRNTAQPFGQPTYIVTWVMTAAISSFVTPCFFAFCR